jgi:ribosomal protein S6
MIDVQDTDGRVYELAYLFVPTLAEETVLGSFGNLKALIEEHKGVFVSEEMPKTMPLAYQMSRTIENKKTWFNDAYFGWIKFEIEPSALEGIEAKLKRDEQILRYMILKTVKENTIASKKPMREYKKRSESKTEGGEPAPEMNKEEVDKQIDALVAE